MSGNYFNGSFGAVDNTLVVQYRHKVSGGDFGPWMNAGIVSTNNNKYVAKATISSLDYTQEYVVQARAIDKIATNGVATKEIVVRTKPVFDWGKEDFAFHTSVYLDNAKQLYGKTTEGQDLMMISLNASNQSFFGYGGYNNNIGSTYFDGNAVNIRSKSNIACTASGTIGGNKSWTNSSDERLKTAIEDIPEVFAQIWMELTPKMFEWNELNHTDGKKQFGLIAQEAITIFNKYGVDYTEFDFISIIPVNEVDYFAITYDHYHMLTAQVLKNTVNELHSLKQEINEIKAMI
jgi:hypothetical protein